LVSCPVVAETPGDPKIPRIHGNLYWIFVDMRLRFRKPLPSKRSYSSHISTFRRHVTILNDSSRNKMYGFKLN
jgi:hypothetical protein